MVRLITHNLLACNAKSCSAPTNFPLRFEQVQKVEIKESELNKDFIKGFLNKLDFNALLYASRALGDADLPESFPIEFLQDPDSISDQLYMALHHALLEVHVQDGNMVCPSCGHIYVIKDGIPNMLLAEHEIKS
ncbi:hypothetical protein Pst134EA_025692 [Puccinia striiformis f. sp. tritici]|uniref:hypothetical protein n=1 Tax=Puccinia striiformis f. sp. tritici TaxID=168172 RepID=UPI0020080F1B|nr:hypothetical protein Pst134EA_025692 [Puccinia striiformis f. sp. tritici]KAH9451754.1 hypothetical protein Pst134EA_025692 [Puccinia striiformis f. sp. tritici]KAI9618498.1 hypothetical protein H4Q26_012319 [Puccinia striiformis f. sp. tritici PST-130]